ncbi:MAG TPA: hypothetical protein VHZ24_18325 [Pirellulales bacterium]|jgi:hypothetical protein|nr:hypothetical protein [Pirellulales bacterium]
MQTQVCDWLLGGLIVSLLAIGGLVVADVLASLTPQFYMLAFSIWAPLSFLPLGVIARRAGMPVAWRDMAVFYVVWLPTALAAELWPEHISWLLALGTSLAISAQQWLKWRAEADASTESDFR